jgi:hypothetical protein
MFAISRLSASFGLGSDWLGETLLTLPGQLRRDVGLSPREKIADPRDLRW